MGMHGLGLLCAACALSLTSAFTLVPRVAATPTRASSCSTRYVSTCMVDDPVAAKIAAKKAEKAAAVKEKAADKKDDAEESEEEKAAREAEEKKKAEEAAKKKAAAEAKKKAEAEAAAKKKAEAEAAAKKKAEADAAAKNPVSIKLEEHGLTQYADALGEQGYTSMASFKNMTSEEAGALADEVKMKPGHKRSFIRAFT